MLSVLIVDNNDSFTYNLVELLRQTNLCTISVCKLEEVLNYPLNKINGIVLSPGPGLPKEKQGLYEFIDRVQGKIPLLGVCLGHQAIAEYFGARIFQLKNIVHGEASQIKIMDEHCIYSGMPNVISVGRYHSWAVEASSLPNYFVVTAETDNGLVMSLKHNALNINSVQFHPESILTKNGKLMLENWLAYCVGEK